MRTFHFMLMITVTISHFCFSTEILFLSFSLSLFHFNPFGSAKRTVRQVNKVKVKGLGLNISYLGGVQVPVMERMRERLQ